jgi:hypothetical protein
MHTVLSDGMGVASSAILVRWAEEPSVRHANSNHSKCLPIQLRYDWLSGA